MEAVMPGQRDDPTDHARTTLPRAGEAMKDNRGLTGYVLMALGILALVICIAAAATANLGWTIGAGVAALLTATAGSIWVYAERRRVARVARENSLDFSSTFRRD
jgi:hypothetical protein